MKFMENNNYDEDDHPEHMENNKFNSLDLSHVACAWGDVLEEFNFKSVKEYSFKDLKGDSNLDFESAPHLKMKLYKYD